MIKKIVRDVLNRFGFELTRRQERLSPYDVQGMVVSEPELSARNGYRFAVSGSQDMPAVRD